MSMGIRGCVAVGALFVLLGGCASEGATKVSSGSGAGAVAPVGAPSGERFTSTPAWEEMGRTIEAAKKAMDYPNAPYGGSKNVSNLRFGVYQTEPIDILERGVYVLRVGPLGDEYQYPSSPVGISLAGPPDATFDSARWEPGEYVKTDRGRYLEVKLSILPNDRFDGPYPGFKMWVS